MLWELRSLWNLLLSAAGTATLQTELQFCHTVEIQPHSEMQPPPLRRHRVTSEEFLVVQLYQVDTAKPILSGQGIGSLCSPLLLLP